MTFASIASQIDEVAQLHTESARLLTEIAGELKKQPPDLERAGYLVLATAQLMRKIAELHNNTSKNISELCPAAAVPGM